MAALKTTAGRKDTSARPAKARPAEDGSAYRYRGASPLESPQQATAKLRLLLTRQRQLISFRSSSLRSVTARLNEQIAQALKDGLQTSVIAEAARLSRADVRRIGRSFEDMQPAGLSATEHLPAICVLSAELAALVESRDSIEGKRLQVLAAARKQRIIDDYELASLSGLTAEHLGRMTWGVGSDKVLPI